MYLYCFYLKKEIVESFKKFLCRDLLKFYILIGFKCKKKKKLGKLYILINFIGLYNKMNFKMNFKKNDSFCFKVRGSFVDILDR